MDVETREVQEIAEEVSAFSGVYVVDACRSPAEDFGENG